MCLKLKHHRADRPTRVKRQTFAPRLTEKILAIGRRCAALLDRDIRSANVIIGYDKYGLPR